MIRPTWAYVKYVSFAVVYILLHHCGSPGAASAYRTCTTDWTRLDFRFYSCEEVYR